MTTQIISVDAHEVDAGDTILGVIKAANPVERVTYRDGVWSYMNHAGLVISTASLADRVRVARERREWPVL